MATQWIALPAGTTIEDVGDSSGNQTTTVVVSAGPDAGTYTSTIKDLADDAKEAKDLAGPSVEIKIEIDTISNDIQKISTTKTL